MKSARYYIAALSVIAAVSVPVVLATNVPEPPPPPEPPRPSAIPNCEATGTIDKTSVDCPTDGSETVVCNLELNTANFGLDNEDCCTCNVPAEVQFTECDPNIDPIPGELTPGECPQDVLVEPTSIIEGVRHQDRACIYKTIRGKRTVFCQAIPPPPPNQRRCARRNLLGTSVLVCF